MDNPKKMNKQHDKAKQRESEVNIAKRLITT